MRLQQGCCATGEKLRRESFDALTHVGIGWRRNQFGQFHKERIRIVNRLQGAAQLSCRLAAVRGFDNFYMLWLRRVFRNTG